MKGRSVESWCHRSSGLHNIPKQRPKTGPKWPETCAFMAANQPKYPGLHGAKCHSRAHSSPTNNLVGSLVKSVLRQKCFWLPSPFVPLREVYVGNVVTASQCEDTSPATQYHILWGQCFLWLTLWTGLRGSSAIATRKLVVCAARCAIEFGRNHFKAFWIHRDPLQGAHVLHKGGGCAPRAGRCPPRGWQQGREQPTAHGTVHVVRRCEILVPGGRRVGQEGVRDMGTQERHQTGGGATQTHRMWEPHQEGQGRAQQTRRRGTASQESQPEQREQGTRMERMVERAHGWQRQ